MPERPQRVSLWRLRKGKQANSAGDLSPDLSQLLVPDTPDDAVPVRPQDLKPPSCSQGTSLGTSLGTSPMSSADNSPARPTDYQGLRRNRKELDAAFAPILSACESARRSYAPSPVGTRATSPAAHGTPSPLERAQSADEIFGSMLKARQNSLLGWTKPSPRQLQAPFEGGSLQERSEPSPGSSRDADSPIRREVEKSLGALLNACETARRTNPPSPEARDSSPVSCRGAANELHSLRQDSLAEAGPADGTNQPKQPSPLSVAHPRPKCVSRDCARTESASLSTVAPGR